jgi:uncharacterized protein DUF4202
MNQSFAPQQRFETALRRFDEENARDPNRQLKDGMAVPRELVYAQWLTEWVLRLNPEASEALRLAARSAHLCRWAIARDSYPMNRAGYLRWREELKKFHARKAGEILRETGYAEEIITRIQGLISKSAFPADPESRVLEDALCLVFLERQFGELAGKSSDEKVINALQKAWKKMTPLAQEMALKLTYTPREKELLDRAFSST